MTGTESIRLTASNRTGCAARPLRSVLHACELDLWPYRRRTTALLRRYGRASVEVGKLPSLLGGELFRSRVTSYTMKSFEDIVIFVADMEQAIAGLEIFDKKLLAMNVLEEYTVPEVARLLGSTQRTIERSLQDALDELSRILLATGLLEEFPAITGQEKVCQGGKCANPKVSYSNKGSNKTHKLGGTPSSNLVS